MRLTSSLQNLNTELKGGSICGEITRGTVERQLLTSLAPQRIFLRKEENTKFYQKSNELWNSLIQEFESLCENAQTSQPQGQRGGAPGALVAT